MEHRPLRRRGQPWLIAGLLAALTLLGLGLRIWRLDRLPAGLHFDEAAHGLLVEGTLLRGEFPVFFSAYTGHEALYHYTLAPMLALLGPTMLALRLPAALWSAALTPAIFLLGARLWNWRVGLLAALATASCGWLVHVGRIGFRANSLPLVSTLALLALFQALATQRRRVWLLAGGLWGLCLYTYLAARALPLLGLLLLVYLALTQRDVLRRNRRNLGWFALALALTVAPLAYHMLRVPGDLFERTRQIGLDGATGGAWPRLLLDQTWATLQMFGVRGTHNGFFNLPGRPVFPGLWQVPFYLGLLLALRAWRSPAAMATLLWLGVMLLPTILAADAPHWLRALGAAPPAMLLWGLGMTRLLDGVTQLGARWLPRVSRPTVVLLAGTIVLAALWSRQTAQAYFNVWARRPELYYEYMQYATDAARAAQQVPAHESLLISEEYYRHATYLYLAPRSRTAQWYDARHAVVWPRSAPWTALISTSTPTTEDIAPLLVAAQGAPYAPDGLFAYMRLQGTSIPPFTPPVAYAARFDGALRLLGYQLEGTPTPGGRLHLRLWLEARARQSRELRLFVHLEDGQGRVLAQDDALGYDAREWQPGDRFISFHTLALPADLPREVRLLIGLYDTLSGERLPTAGTGAQGDTIILPLTTEAHHGTVR